MLRQELPLTSIPYSKLSFSFIEQDTYEDYSSKVAQTIEEACKLIETGFEYVTEMDGVKSFEKGSNPKFLFLEIFSPIWNNILNIKKKDIQIFPVEG